MALLRHPRSPFYSSEGVSPNERPLLPREGKVPGFDREHGLIRRPRETNTPFDHIDAGDLRTGGDNEACADDFDIRPGRHPAHPAAGRLGRHVRPDRTLRHENLFDVFPTH